MVEPLTTTLSTSSEPKLPRPVVEIALAPLSIDPKPEVIEPAFKAPTVVTLDKVSRELSKYTSKSVKATCFIVPASLTTTRSASARVVEVAEVSPSIIFNSAVLTSAPSRIPTSASLRSASAAAAALERPAKDVKGVFRLYVIVFDEPTDARPVPAAKLIASEDKATD